MKIRKGFVSNSSSTSFCLYGYRIPGDDVKEFASNLLDEYDKFKVESTEMYDPTSDEFDFCAVLTLIDNKHSKSPNDISIVFDAYSEDCYYGRDPESLRDDENGKEFKESILYMKKLFPNLSNPDWIIADISD